MSDAATFHRWRQAAPVALAALFIVEFLFFDQIGARHHTWVYPRWNDQIQYLTEAYTGYEHARVHGLAQGWWHAFTNPAAQGTLHDVWTLAIFTVAGPSRSAALSVNMLWFIGWQLALYLVITRVLYNRPLAWAAVGLLLVLRGPWSDTPGSAIDFRLDWMATCAIGVTLAAAVATRRFQCTGASALFGMAMGMTLLTRFLTGTYLAVICLIFFVWTLCQRGRLRGALNLSLACVTTVAMGAPVFWINREWVWNYYFIGHFTGPESAIRNPHMGVWQSTTWLLDVLQRDHVGAVFWFVAGAMLLGSTIALLVRRRRKDDVTPRSSTGPRADAWVPAVAFFAAPVVILTLHQQKSGLVVGNVLPSVVMMVVLLWGCFEAGNYVRTAFAAIVVVTGLTFFAVRMFHNPHTAEFVTYGRKVNMLADAVLDRSRVAGLTNPSVAVDQVTDCLDAQVLRVICYERRHVWIPFSMTLPTGIMQEREELLMERLAHSDFVFLTEDNPVGGGWPYDVQMRALLPKTQAWCEQNLRRVDQFTLFSRGMVLYERRDLP